MPGGIYLITADGKAYVGKACDLRSRERQYRRNVKRLNGGLPYRKANPDGYRKVHRAMAVARELSFTILEYGDADLIARERHWISRLKPELNG